MQAFDRNAIGSLHEAMESIAIDSCTFRSPEIVLILGESYKQTPCSIVRIPAADDAPTVAGRGGGPSLSLHRRGIAGQFHGESHASALLLRQPGPANGVVRHTAIPALFRRAGYDTLMFDNQTTFTLENDDVWDQEIRHFLYHPRLSPQLFTHCNADKYPFDEGLLADFDRQDLRFRNPHRLTIFHLMGQHVAYRNRFPPKRVTSRPTASPNIRPRGCGEAATNAALSPTTTTPSATTTVSWERSSTVAAHATPWSSTSPTTARRCSITPTATDASTMRRSRPTAAVTNTRFPS